MRSVLDNLFCSVGLNVKIFETAKALLANELPDIPTCLVLDVQMPGLSGLDLQIELAKANIQIPIIMMTSYGDIPMSVKAMKAGAVDFLAKPFRDQDMLDAVAAALERHRDTLERRRENSDLKKRYESHATRTRRYDVGHVWPNEQANRG